MNCYERRKDLYTITKLEKEIGDHYLNQLLKQIHVLVLGLDVLGNLFGLARGVAEGVESFFYEPYQVKDLSFKTNAFFIPNLFV